MDNKVVQTLARAFVQLGWRAVRFNFRGVGASAGAWDEGRGEVDDALAVVVAGAATRRCRWRWAAFPSAATWPAQAPRGCRRRRAGARLVLVGPAVPNFPPAAGAGRTRWSSTARPTTWCRWPAVLDWARPQVLPVTVVPGVGHFFHGQLALLKQSGRRRLRALNPFLRSDP
jgi:uncharacterized protein